MDLISGAVQKFLDSEALCECFCCAVDRLAKGTPGGPSALGEGGVCKLVVRVMQIHEKCEGDSLTTLPTVYPLPT